jgi:hypothetical protein
MFPEGMMKQPTKMRELGMAKRLPLVPAASRSACREYLRIFQKVGTIGESNGQRENTLRFSHRRIRLERRNLQILQGIHCESK